MRVLVVAATPPWPMTDGASLVLNHQLRHLSHRHEITVLAAGRPPDGRAPDPASIGLGEQVAVHWFGPRDGRTTGYAKRRWASLRTGEPIDVFAVELPDLLTAFEAAANEADLVHLHGWGTARLAGRSRTPTVHMPIDAWQRGLGEQRRLPAWRRTVEADQLRKVVRHEGLHYPRCDAVVVVAPADAAVLRTRAPGARIEVIPNGVDAGDPPAEPATEPILGFHGVLSTVANEAAALTLVDDVLPRVRVTHPNARAMVIGKDPGRALLRRRSDTVEVTGAVPELRAALAKVSVYVAALDRGSGIKNKVLEAMAAGLPVVATPRAVDGIHCDAGIVVADSVAGIADAASCLLAEGTERRRLGRAGRTCAEASSWAASAAALEDLWCEVAAGGAR